jgi:hypothetical protein
VVNFDHDPHLHEAAVMTGRAYLAITDAGHLAELDGVDQRSAWWRCAGRGTTHPAPRAWSPICSPRAG